MKQAFVYNYYLHFVIQKKWKGIYKVSALKLIETLFLLIFFQVKLKNHIEKICFILSDMYNVAWPTISFCPHEPSSSFSFFLCFLWGVIITARSKISQTPKLSWSIRPHHNSVISLLKNFNSKKKSSSHFSRWYRWLELKKRAILEVCLYYLFFSDLVTSQDPAMRKKW